MINLTSKEELEKKFIVLGSFYKIKTSHGELIPCRNLLEIYNKACFKSAAQKATIYENKADAVFIMMNPGSSSPQDNSYNETEILFNEADTILNNPLVLANSDETQCQIMRLMELKDWNHVRIINLSDIREPNSSKFLKRVKDFEESCVSRIHSIFCDERKEELELVLSSKENSNIILAWGTDKGLLKLIDRCLIYLGERSVKGLKHKRDYRLYYHPSSPLKSEKQKWLINIKTVI